MDRDLERLIQGLFAAYRLIKRLNTRRKKFKTIQSEPKVTPLWQRKPIHFDSMDAVIAKEREQGYMR